MSDEERFSYLLDRYVSGTLSGDEHNEFFVMINTNRFDVLLSADMLKDLKNGEHNTDAGLPPHVAHEIIRNIYLTEKSTKEILPVIGKRSLNWKWMAAASILLVVLVSYFTINGKDNKESFVSLIPGTSISKTNSGAAPITIALDDGSLVTLSPSSTVHYAKKFTGDSREIYLEGEAFFEVAKNLGKPFFVYYNTIVTKVLGTSFRINTSSETGDIEVSVRTGKVQVYENKNLTEERPSEVAVIVTPNQKAVYKKTNRLFETLLVDQPQPISNEAPGYTEGKKRPNFIFEQEKLLTVFQQIEKTYGIEIVPENTAINDCIFTGDVSTNDLHKKLEIICLTVNASYQINGTKILIKGNGCN